MLMPLFSSDVLDHWSVTEAQVLPNLAPVAAGFEIVKSGTTLAISMQKIMHINYSIDALTSRTLTYNLETLFSQQHKNIMHITTVSMPWVLFTKGQTTYIVCMPVIQDFYASIVIHKTCHH